MLRRRADERGERDRERVDAAIDALLSAPEAQSDLEALSDLSRAGQERLKDRWLELPTQSRAALVQRMLADAEETVGHSFGRAMLVALDDPVANVRVLAVEGLWESSDATVLPLLLERLPEETDSEVRRVMVRRLGHCALQAQLGQLPDSNVPPLRAALRDSLERDPDPRVRTEALESIAYLVDEPDLAELIQAAYDTDDAELRAAALRSMGRQADQRWSRRVLEAMRLDEPELRFEAARAAGMLSDARAVQRLIDLVYDDEDGEVRLAAVEALGEIGSEEAVRVLRELAAGDEPAIAEAAEAALDVATLTDAPAGPPRVV
jgi:HEAT repeat protein